MTTPPNSHLVVPFRSVARCPKCTRAAAAPLRDSMPDITYVPLPADAFVGSGHVEHLRHKCDCGFVWLEACADAATP